MAINTCRTEVFSVKDRLETVFASIHVGKENEDGIDAFEDGGFVLVELGFVKVKRFGGHLNI